MIEKIYNLVFGIHYFNPYVFELRDMDNKLCSDVCDKKITVLRVYSTEDNLWYVQLMVCDYGKFEKYKYQDNLVLSNKPNIFTFLFKSNVLVTRWLEDLPKLII